MKSLGRIKTRILLVLVSSSLWEGPYQSLLRAPAVCELVWCDGQGSALLWTCWCTADNKSALLARKCTAGAVIGYSCTRRPGRTAHTRTGGVLPGCLQTAKTHVSHDAQQPGPTGMVHWYILSTLIQTKMYGFDITSRNLWNKFPSGGNFESTNMNWELHFISYSVLSLTYVC